MKWFSLNQHQRSWILQKLTLISDFQGTLRKLLNPRSAGVKNTVIRNNAPLGHDNAQSTIRYRKNMRYGLQGDDTMVPKNTLSSRF